MCVWAHWAGAGWGCPHENDLGFPFAFPELLGGGGGETKSLFAYFYNSNVLIDGAASFPPLFHLYGTNISHLPFLFRV